MLLCKFKRTCIITVIVLCPLFPFFVMVSHVGAFCANKKLMNPLFIISAIATVVTVAEILKNNGLAVEKSKILVACMCILFSYIIYSNSIESKSIAEIMTSTVDVNDDSRNRPIQKAKVRCVLVLEIN